ncbi:MAG TPA: hypothetical protein VJ350_06920 [Methanoregula sp.]|nr:hypothetical protein [Methanoregula sp.]
MQFRVMLVIIVVLCGALASAGCTFSKTSPAAPTPGSGTPAGTSTIVAGSGLTTVPTDVIPSYNMVTVDVGEKDYLGKIPVIFQGGIGMIHVKKIEAKLTRADGTVQTATIGIKKGDQIELDGTRGEGPLRGPIDRIEVWVTMDNGLIYKTNDELREYRTRG